MNTREINELIIGSSYRIYNKMGFGFPEAVYRNCLLLELQKMKLQAEANRQLLGASIRHCPDPVLVTEAPAVIRKSVAPAKKTAKRCNQICGGLLTTTLFPIR